MLLELGKAVSFVCCILSLYSVLVSAFFELAATWQQRLDLGLSRLALAACVSFASGILFRVPAKANPQSSAQSNPQSSAQSSGQSSGQTSGQTSPNRAVSLLQTLPVRLFLCSAAAMAVLFCLAWYLRCGGINSFDSKTDCYLAGCPIFATVSSSLWWAFAPPRIALLTPPKILPS